jgi:mono/diheme cytochrome c family protein
MRLSSLFLPLVLFAFTAPARVSAAEEEARPVTFSEDIAPLIFHHCAACHRAGQIGPFALTDYESVKRRARQIVEVTADRTMPPWHADPGVVKYSNDPSLTQDQIALLADWVEAGMPQGDPAKTPVLPPQKDGWQLGPPDLIATMPEAFTVPAEGRDIYRKFVIPLNLEKDTWVKGVEFHPGDPKVVHHILYYLDPTGKAREYDARDPGPGFRGMSQSNGEFRYMGGWDVGTQPSELPHGLRYFIPKGTDLVVQIHYHPMGRETADQSSVGFYFADEPTARPWSIIPVPPHFGAMQGIDIPAGAKDHEEKASFVIPADCEAFSVNAHAHYLGKRMEMTATFPDGTTRWLLKTSHWDFKWQEDYFFEKPIKLPAGTRLDVLMSYDNSAENPANPTQPPRRVIWGPATTDEMGVITLAVMFDTPEQKEATHQALRVFLAHQVIDRLLENDVTVFGLGRSRAGSASQIRAQQNFDRARAPLLALDLDNDGKLSPVERLPAVMFILQSPYIKDLGAIGLD